ncbi:hypothetical protein [Mycoplasma anserisalpingitidis]|uniref:hypothetical protein n=1 Tax=Mycoplasma anserisalpingitidis TaxID=519450 RepID=UPI0019201A7F|nr:hypothetical protein [Mycoplasma anserisalpingitidis]
MQYDCIGELAGRQRAFLIQNAFPVKEIYVDHIHILKGKEIYVHEELGKKLRSYLKDVIEINKTGVKVFFTNVNEILKKL